MLMKILLAQPAIPRFQWELEVLLTNIRQFTDLEVVLLFTEHDFTVPAYLRKKYGCTVFTFTDKRDNKMYIPSVRPWLLSQYLAAHPEAQQELHFYIDSDIIFREWPHFATLGFAPNKVVGSDCSGYLDYDYIIQCERGQAIAKRMANICGITVEQMKGVPGIGAHLLLDQPKADFWQRVYKDSNELWIYLSSVDSNIQQWTAEMWAQLWGWVREGYTIEAPKELDFCRPTDPIEEWDKVKIMHNAGVTEAGKMFFKGQYVNKTPFGEDFSEISENLVTAKYVDAIKKVIV